MSALYPTQGEPFGCRDGGRPETYSDWQLSRAADIIRMASTLEPLLGEEFYRAIIAALPERLRFELQWNRWSYEEMRP